jgi:hypothetical protein
MCANALAASIPSAGRTSTAIVEVSDQAAIPPSQRFLFSNGMEPSRRFECTRTSSKAMVAWPPLPAGRRYGLACFEQFPDQVDFCLSPAPE